MPPRLLIFQARGCWLCPGQGTQAAHCWSPFGAAGAGEAAPSINGSSVCWRGGEGAAAHGGWGRRGTGTSGMWQGAGGSLGDAGPCLGHPHPDSSDRLPQGFAVASRFLRASPLGDPIAPPVTPFLTHHLPHPFANHLGSAWGCCPCWEPLVAQKLDSFDFQSDFRPKVPSLPAGTPQVPALGSPPDKTLLSHSEKQPDCAYLSRLEGFMLGKDVFWEHSVSGLPVTNPRLPLSSRAEREGCWPCLSWQM